MVPHLFSETKQWFFNGFEPWMGGRSCWFCTLATSVPFLPVGFVHAWRHPIDVSFSSSNKEEKKKVERCSTSLSTLHEVIMESLLICSIDLCAFLRNGEPQGRVDCYRSRWSPVTKFSLIFKSLKIFLLYLTTVAKAMFTKVWLLETIPSSRRWS